MQTNSNYNDLIIFSALLSDYEKLDFKNDALAGVRANYFNSNLSDQSEKTDILLNEQTYNLSYFMKNGVPLNWKITRNHTPYQNVKKTAGEVYVVLSYNENGVVNKRQYFNSEHIWLRTEYFNESRENSASAVLSPTRVSGTYALEYKQIDMLGNRTSVYLFPSLTTPNHRCQGLAYTNYGMMWFDSEFKPENVEFGTDSANKKSGFNFSASNFDNSSNVIVACDLEGAEYLEKIEPSASQPASADEPKEYSAYDKIEQILFDAHKTNKDLFGAILTHAPSSSDEAISEPAEPSDSQTTTDTLTEHPVEEATEQAEDVVEEATEQSEDAVEEATEQPEKAVDLDDEKFNADDEQPADSKIQTKTGEYSYYGALSVDNKRVGRGRTVTPEGITSYEGYYQNDKRHGFGVCYYKNGSVNYVGDWLNGSRTGAGVGYRQSDGTMHAGRWTNNKPDGIGARFDSEGNFIDVGTYANGTRNGKTVSFDDDGNVVVSFYKDGELVYSKTLDDEDLK